MTKWQTMPIRRLFRIVNGGTPSGDPENWNGDVPWATPVDLGLAGGRLTSTARTITTIGLHSGSQLVPTGSILLSTRAPIGHVAEATVATAFNQGCKALVPSADVNPRYFYYQVLSLVDELRSRGQGSTFQELSADGLADVRVIVPALDDQRRIADFLDAETARLDALAARQRSAAVLLGERRSRCIEDQLAVAAEASGASWVPLMHLTDQYRPIMYGIVLPGPAVDDGVPIVKGGDVAAGRMNPDQLSRTTREIESGYVRSRLRGGDLVIAIRGSVGEIATVPDSLTGANLTQDAARISVGVGISVRWLELALQAPSVERQIRARITGATVKGINIWDLKRILIPTPTPFVQVQIADALDNLFLKQEALRAKLRQQLSLLSERRQALITAAVTGQFDVTTGRGADLS